MAYLIEKWKELLFIFTVVACAWNFYGLKISAQEASQKVIQFEQTFQMIADIAKDLKDPSSWLRNNLIIHGIDSSKAKLWSQYPQGAITDSLNKPVSNIPFLSKEVLPDLGIFKNISNHGDTLILDTLWDFRVKCEK